MKSIVANNGHGLNGKNSLDTWMIQTTVAAIIAQYQTEFQQRVQTTFLAVYLTGKFI